MIIFRTNELNLNKNIKAKAASDFQSILNSNYVIIQNGSTYASLNITILNDSISELDEKLEVVLVGVEVVGVNPVSENRPVIGDNNRLNVTIRANDFPHGLFELEVDREQVLKNGSRYFIYEPDDINVPLTFFI